MTNEIIFDSSTQLIVTYYKYRRIEFYLVVHSVLNDL